MEKYIWDGTKIVAVSDEWLRTHKNRHGTFGAKLQRFKVGGMTLWGKVHGDEAAN